MNKMTGLYIGYATEIIYKNDMPTMELRVRVPSIHGLNASSGVSDEDLPIASPLFTPGLVYSKEKFEEAVYSLNKIYVIFESGDLNNPVYFGLKGNYELYPNIIDEDSFRLFAKSYPTAEIDLDFVFTDPKVSILISAIGKTNIVLEKYLSNMLGLYAKQKAGSSIEIKEIYNVALQLKANGLGNIAAQMEFAINKALNLSAISLSKSYIEINTIMNIASILKAKGLGSIALELEEVINKLFNLNSYGVTNSLIDIEVLVNSLSELKAKGLGSIAITIEDLVNKATTLKATSIVESSIEIQQLYNELAELKSRGLGQAALALESTLNKAIIIKSSNLVASSIDFGILENVLAALKASNLTKASVDFGIIENVLATLKAKGLGSIALEFEIEGPAVHWVPGGTEEEANSTPNTCESVGDIGNVREKITSYSYNWKVVRSYTAGSDETNTTLTCNKPEDEGNPRIVCNFDEFFGVWLCTEFECEVTENISYEKCELVEEE